MQIDRPNMVYHNGLLAEQNRERVNTVPVRYKRTWTVCRVIELDAGNSVCTASTASLLMMREIE